MNDSPFSSLIWGENGTGKTTLTYSATLHPDFLPMLYVNIDNGTTPIESRDGVRFISFDRMKELIQFMTAIRSRSKEYQGIASALIDSGTAFSDRILNNFVMDRLERNSRQKGISEAELMAMAIPQIQEYGAIKNIVSTLMYELQSQKIKLLVTAGSHETTMQDDKNQPVVASIEPRFTKGVREDIMLRMRYVFMTTIGQDGNYKLLYRRKPKIKDIKVSDIPGDKESRIYKFFDELGGKDGVLTIKMNNGMIYPSLSDIYKGIQNV